MKKFYSSVLLLICGGTFLTIQDIRSEDVSKEIILKTEEQIQLSKSSKLILRKLESNLKSLEDLPESIQSFIKSRSHTNVEYIKQLPLLDQRLKDLLFTKNELEFRSASIYISEDKLKQYEIIVNFYGITNLPLVFDENGKLIWVGSFQRIEKLSNFDNTTSSLETLSEKELNFFLEEFTSIQELNGFVIYQSSGLTNAFLNEYSGVKCYELHLTKPNEKGNESWILRYNSERQIISSNFISQ